jgi:hypothetical protein
MKRMTPEDSGRAKALAAIHDIASGLLALLPVIQNAQVAERITLIISLARHEDDVQTQEEREKV